MLPRAQAGGNLGVGCLGEKVPWRGFGHRLDGQIHAINKLDKLELFYQVDSARLCPSKPQTYVDSLLDFQLFEDIL